MKKRMDFNMDEPSSVLRKLRGHYNKFVRDTNSQISMEEWLVMRMQVIAETVAVEHRNHLNKPLSYKAWAYKKTEEESTELEYGKYLGAKEAGHKVYSMLNLILKDFQFNN